MSDSQQFSLQQQQVLSALMNQNSQFPGKINVTAPASMNAPYGFSANLNTRGASGLNS